MDVMGVVLFHGVSIMWIPHITLDPPLVILISPLILTLLVRWYISQPDHWVDACLSSNMKCTGVHART